MTSPEHSARHHNQRALAEAIARAVQQVCVSRDLPDGIDTERAILDAFAQRSQLHQIKLDRMLRDSLDVSPDLGESAWERAGKKCPEDIAVAVQTLVLGKGGR